MATKLPALAIGAAAALLALACDDRKNDAPATTPTTASPADSSARRVEAPPAISPAMSAGAAPAASASGSTDAAPPVGPIDLSLGDIQVTKGKVDGAKPFRSALPQLRRQCVATALRKDGTSLGNATLKLTLDIGADGKVKKSSHTLDGKVPDEVVKCIKSYLEKEVAFPTTSQATLAVTLAFGPRK